MTSRPTPRKTLCGIETLDRVVRTHSGTGIEAVDMCRTCLGVFAEQWTPESLTTGAVEFIGWRASMWHLYAKSAT